MEQVSDFYCKDCRIDFTAKGHRQFVNRIFTDALVANCTSCSRICIRSLVNRVRDPYYLRSKKIRRAREKHKRSLLQPGDKMYDVYYKS